MFTIAKGYQRYFDNDVAALVPEWWARQSLRLLDKKTRILPLVNRDYEEFFQEAGDIVNLNKDGSFTAKRKFQGQPITIQDVKSTKDWVALNQQLHVSFLLDDQDMRRTFGQLSNRYMLRAAIALAEGIDAVMMGETYQFRDYMAGKIGTAISDSSILDLREQFVRNEVPDPSDGEPRFLLVGPSSEREILDVPRFVEMDKIGDGSPLRTGMIGRVRGFDVIQTSQAWEVPAGNDTWETGRVNNAGGYPAGTTTLTVDGFTGGQIVTVGSWCLIAGDDRPQRITAQTDDATDTTEITIEPGLNSAVLDDAVITVWQPFLVNQANPTDTQASGYDFQSGEDIVIDGFTNPPKLGQGVTIGATGTDFYTVTGVDLTASSITLNRPLDAGVLNNVPIFPMPRGNYNLAIIRDAMTFVNRPLMPPDAGTGVRSYTASYRGVAIRVTIGYDMIYERIRVTLSTLCGVKTLNTAMGGVLVS